MTVCDNLHVNHSHDRWWYMIYTHILQCSVIYCAHFYREFYLNTRLPGALHSIWSVTTFNRLNSNEKNMANKLHGVWTYFSCIRFALVLNAFIYVCGMESCYEWNKVHQDKILQVDTTPRCTHENPRCVTCDDAVVRCFQNGAIELNNIFVAQDTENLGLDGVKEKNTREWQTPRSNTRAQISVASMS